MSDAASKRYSSLLISLQEHTRFLLLHLRLVYLPDHFQIELASRARSHATEDPCVGGKREWNLSQIIYPRPGGNGYCRNLSDLDS